ncbi:MAG: S9 family peptidase [Chloroflexota bacterium]|nr:S9 family peptidase [Chloroflexota bacterium]
MLNETAASQNNNVAFAQSQQTPVKPDTILKDIRLVGETRISPDGKRVAFNVAEWVQDKPKLRWRIWSVDTAGGEAKPLTKSARGDTTPRWSPDSKQLAFISLGEVKGDKPQLHLMSAEGSTARQVCTMPNGVGDIRWSPDGSRIAFLSEEGEEPKSDPHVLTPEFTRHRRLWTVRHDSDTPEPVTPDSVTVWEYAWSPDSRQIALYYTTGSDETDWYRGQIGIVSSKGGAVRQVTQLRRQARSLAWSPDGTQLAYISGEWSDPGIGGGDIYILSLKDGETRNLTPNITFSPGWLQWFPDGSKLLYVAWEDVTNSIGMVDVKTGAITPLEKDFIVGRIFRPSLSATSDLQKFAITHSEQHPPDVWLGTLSSANETPTGIEWKRLTRMNPLLEETITVAPNERIRYESGDGWQIDAILTLPTKKEEGKLPPLIVNVHGGPSSAWVDDWDNYRTQMLVAAGYAVLRPNIRGSMGRGVAFADAVIGDMGGKDFQDVMAGVNYLVKHGLVDGNRVGIMGWSYGGFMAAWAVTQTTRFKAAIMGAGVCDFHSFHAQSNIQDWDMRFLSDKEISPSEYPEIYRERSAITYVNRVQTPTLVVHGEEDACVPVNQAYAFYRALKECNVPTELVLYPREGHGLAERDHLKDYHERILLWFARYL